MTNLSIIQKTYELIKWYVPILNQLPQDHKFLVGDQIISGLYDLLEGLIRGRYSKEKLPQFQALNAQLDIWRHQTKLLLDFRLLPAKRLWDRKSGDLGGARLSSLGDGCLMNRYENL